jgi:hypothetical protein
MGSKGAVEGKLLQGDITLYFGTKRDEANKLPYLNGTVQFAGMLYIDHIKDSPDITKDDSSSCEYNQGPPPISSPRL